MLVACILWFVYTFLHTCATGHSTVCCSQEAESHGHGQVVLVDGGAWVEAEAEVEAVTVAVAVRARFPRINKMHDSSERADWSWLARLSCLSTRSRVG